MASFLTSGGLRRPENQLAGVHMRPRAEVACPPIWLPVPPMERVP